MGHLRGQTFRGIKELVSGAQGVNHSNKLVHHGYHGLFVASEVLVFFHKIGPKTLFPLHYPHRHLKQNVSQVRIALLGNTHLHFPFARLFNDRVGSCVFDEFFGTGKPFYFSHFSQKSSGKAGRDFLYGRETFELISLRFFDFFLKEHFEFLDFGFKEEEFFHIEFEDFFESGVVEADGVLSQRDQLRGREGELSAWTGSLDDFSDFFFTGSGNGVSRGIKGKDGEEGFREDGEMVFCFREEDCQSLFDLSFSFSEFLFEFFALSSDELSFGGDRGRREEVGVSEGEKGQDEGVFLVGLGRIVGGDKGPEAANHFWIEDEDVEAFGEQESEKSDVESTGRFEDYEVRGELGSYFQELFKPLSGDRKGFGTKDSLILIKDAEIEGVFRDIYADVEHDFTSGLRWVSLISILPGGWGFWAQPTYWELRDRGTDSQRGSMAGIWSPCPSINLSPGVLII